MKQDVVISSTLNVSLSDAWLVLRDFGSLIHWVTGGEQGTVALSGQGVGMTRDLDLPVVGKVQHRLDVLDEHEHTIAYTLTRGEPIGMQDYEVAISLAPATEGCLMTWRGRFSAVSGFDAEQVGRDLARVYETTSALFERYVLKTSN